MYLAAINVKSTQENKEYSKHIQQVMEHNATSLALLKEQQKKIKELIKQKTSWKQWLKKNRNQGLQEAWQDKPETPKNNGVNTAKKWEHIAATSAFHWKQMKINSPNSTSKESKTKAMNLERQANNGEWDLTTRVQNIIK